MATFLLISIGSVCASENTTADSDVLSASDEADVVLQEDVSTDILNNGSGEGETTTEKITTTINATGDKEKYGFDEDKNISVEVKDNESKDVENINGSDFSVLEGEKSINFTYNNSKISIIEKLSVGNHSLIINYLGNSNYTNSSTTFLLKIFGNKTLEAPTTVVSDGNRVEIPDVKVSDGVDYFALNKDDLSLNLTYTDENGNTTSKIISEFEITNGIISFDNTIKLIAAHITLNYTDAVNTKTVEIKLSTKVNASDARIRDTEDKNITVVILDGQNNPLNITKGDLKVLENNKEIAFDYNNTVISIPTLATGKHSLTIVYLGNETYNTSNKTVVISVWGNKTINPEKIAYLDENQDVEIYLNLSDGSDLVDVDLNRLSVTLYYKVGNQTLNKTIPRELIILKGDKQTIEFKVTGIFDSATANIKYVAETNLTADVTLKISTVINASDYFVKGESEVKNFTIEVKGSDGKIINVNASNIQVLKDGKALKITCNNSEITITDSLAAGIYNLTIKYTGNSTYGEATKLIVLKVYGINATSKIDVNSTKIGELKVNLIDGNESYNINPADITLKASYKNGNNTTEISIDSWTLVNGTLKFTLGGDGKFSSATLTITYNNTETNVTLNRIYNVKIDIVNNVNEYKSGNFTFRVTDIDDPSFSLENKTISLYTTGNIRAGFTGKINSKNLVNYATKQLYVFDQSSGGINIKELEVGQYAVELTTSSPLISTTVKTNLTVTKANLNIVIEKFKEEYQTTKKVKITVTNAKTGEAATGLILKLYMPQTSGKTYYFQTNENGISEISVSQLVGGTYDITVSNNDTKNHNKKTVKGTITITPKPVKISASSFTMSYNSGLRTNIKITDKKTGKAINGAILTVKFDNNKKKTYLVQTNKNGIFKLSSIPVSLAVGKHKMTISTSDTRYKGTSVTKTITVKKASGKITAKKVTTYYKGTKYFTVKVTNTKNKHAISDAKLNIKVYISKNRYYNYTGSTGTNGIIKLSLDNLKPGKYKVVVSAIDPKNYVAKKVNSKIVVKKAPTKFIAKKVTAKKGAKKYFKVTAKNKKTKAVIKGIKVKIKVYTGKKYKTYTVKTNSKGIAKISTKSLKVGKHKVVIKSANKYCVAKTTKSSIKITKK